MKKILLPLKVVIAIALVAYIAVPSWGSERGESDSIPTNPASNKVDLVRYVNPFCGTAKDGDCYPGAALPFGMIQWGPDTGPRMRQGGYYYGDTMIYGFSVNHLSGAGCLWGQDFAFSPLLNTSSISPSITHLSFPEPFSHLNETAHPGFYSVTLDNKIKVELTATTRTGFGRFNYPVLVVAVVLPL